MLTLLLMLRPITAASLFLTSHTMEWFVIPPVGIAIGLYVSLRHPTKGETR